jgi:hypothetical protein
MYFHNIIRFYLILFIRVSNISVRAQIKTIFIFYKFIRSRCGGELPSSAQSLYSWHASFLFRLKIFDFCFFMRNGKMIDHAVSSLEKRLKLVSCIPTFSINPAKVCPGRCFFFII